MKRPIKGKLYDYSSKHHQLILMFLETIKVLRKGKPEFEYKFVVFADLIKKTPYIPFDFGTSVYLGPNAWKQCKEL